jgi:murein DD-endopeptidase MepM/ murein hydrolase activator NlpD
MPTRPKRSLDWTIGGVFAERRVYIRTEGKTRYLQVKPAAQICSVFAIAAVLGWSAFTTYAFVARAVDGRTARIQLETMSEAYEAKLAVYGGQQRILEVQLNQANQRRDEVTAILSDKQARLVETADQLQEANAELAVLRDGFESLDIAHRGKIAEAKALEAELDDLRAEMSENEISKSNLDGGLTALAGAMDAVIAERDRNASENSILNGKVIKLSDAIAELEDRQNRLFSQLEDAAASSLGGLESLFGRSDIDLDRIMAQARRDYSGSGGPFEPVSEDVSGTAGRAGPGDERVAALMNEFESINLMRFAADRLPFGDPVLDGRRTSGFGVRIDPKGRGRSMHDGLDIAAPRGTAIYSTADGVVTFSGRQSGYGIVVKIRHAFGFETVYAHLSRANVKVGQHVSRGDRIADMGSTGRSTGSHLHYEIRIDQQPVNPIKFIEAARDVL